MTDARPFSDVLLEAAGRIEEMSREELARLLYKAAVRLRAVQVVGVRLEHIPVPAYHLLRRLAEQPVSVRGLGGREVKAAVGFLTSRGLAALDDGGLQLVITPAGLEIGEIADERDAEPGIQG
jgi:hypothetical protein